MSRLIRGGAVALPAFLAAGVIAAFSLPAHAASTWSSPVALPSGGAGVGQFAENSAGAQATVWTTGTQGASSVVVSTSSSGLTWAAPKTLDPGSSPVVATAANGRVVAAWEGGPATAQVIQASVLAPGGTWSAPVIRRHDRRLARRRRRDPDCEPAGRGQLDGGRYAGYAG
jgi:hypothetical protein